MAKKERTKHIQSWDELIRFVDSVNLYNETIVLTGWIGEVVSVGKDKVSCPIKALVFSTRPIGILQDGKNIKKKKK